MRAFVFFVTLVLSHSAIAIELPAPTGPHKVGTFSHHLVDPAREETFTDDPADKREIMIQFWYPATPAAHAEPAKYVPGNEDALQTMFGPRAVSPMGIPPAKLDEFIRPLRTHSYLDAPADASNNPYPVLIFSHGFGGFRTQNTSQCEDLASHGYVVVGIDHTYNCGVTVFPDGRVVEFDRRVNTGDAMAIEARMNGIVMIWAGDAALTADYLAAIAPAASDHPLAGKLDLERIGIFGHSFGGATAAQICSTDERFKAGIDMDGMPFGPVVEAGVHKPFLILKGGREAPSPQMLAMAQMTPEKFEEQMDRFDSTCVNTAKSAAPGYLVVIKGMKHFNFTDFPYIAHLSAVAPMVVGEFDPAKGGKLINNYTLAFFNKHLRGQDAKFPPHESADFPEVSFTPF